MTQQGLTNDELTELLIEVSNAYNPYVVDYDPYTLYYAGADALTEVEKLIGKGQQQYLNAIVDYMWAPVVCVD